LSDHAKWWRAAALILAATMATGPVGAAPKSFLIGSFEDLRVEGDIIVILDNNRSPSAKADGERSLIDALKIDQNGMTVRVRVQDYQGQTKRAKANQPVVVRLGGRGVKRITTSGSATIKVNQIKQEDATAVLTVSGSGSITVDQLAADRLTVSVFGSGDVTLASGTARVGDFKVDGNGTITAANLALRQAKLLQSGAAKTHLSVSDEVEITNNGAGTITVDGKATCFIRKPGSAKIICGKLAQ
jgi:Putative auto-transporter adhesin, head GIN domain